jgi:hypothetical protein
MDGGGRSTLSVGVHGGAGGVDGVEGAEEGAVEEAVWKEGEWIVFDDTHEHSARNEGDEERVVLLVDFMR